MKKRNTARNYMKDTGAYMAGVLEYLCGELFEVSLAEMVARKKKTLKPAHINAGIRNDDELAKLFYSI